MFKIFALYLIAVINVLIASAARQNDLIIIVPFQWPVQTVRRSCAFPGFALYLLYFFLIYRHTQTTFKSAVWGGIIRIVANAEIMHAAKHALIVRDIDGGSAINIALAVLYAENILYLIVTI